MTAPRRPHIRPHTEADKTPVAPHGCAVSSPDPTYHELHARLLLAQSLINHRLDTHNPDVAAVLAVLRGDLSLAGVE